MARRKCRVCVGSKEKYYGFVEFFWVLFLKSFFCGNEIRLKFACQFCLPDYDSSFNHFFIPRVPPHNLQDNTALFYLFPNFSLEISFAVSFSKKCQTLYLRFLVFTCYDFVLFCLVAKQLCNFFEKKENLSVTQHL